MHRRKILLIITAAVVYAISPAGLSKDYSVNLPIKSFFGGGISAEKVSRLIKTAAPYQTQLFASDLPSPRMLALSAKEHLIVSSAKKGTLLLFRKHLTQKENHQWSNKPQILIAGVSKPHGIAFYQDWLYFAESDQISRVKFDETTAQTSGPTEVLIDNLPSGGNHWSRTLHFGPDHHLYVAFGSSCNVCIEKDPRRAAIWRYKADGSDGRLFASGLRNSVDFDWNQDNQLYATDNGRDLLGDHYPACELNHIEDQGFYGWPYFNNDNEPDPDFGKQYQNRAASLPIPIAPVHHFKAHNAPLGIAFLKSPHTPSQFKHTALVALHGSWNKSYKDGYKVVSLHWRKPSPLHTSQKPRDSSAKTELVGEKDFVWGFLQEGKVIGRPVDIVQTESGSLFISDDFANAIYFTSRRENSEP